MPEPTYSDLLDAACQAEDTSTPRGRGVVAQKMVVVVAKIHHPLPRKCFLLEVARRLQISPSFLLEEVRKAEAQMPSDATE